MKKNSGLIFLNFSNLFMMCLGALGAAFCFVTAFSLNVSDGKIVSVCVICSAFFITVSLLKKKKVRIIAVASSSAFVGILVLCFLSNAISQIEVIANCIALPYMKLIFNTTASFTLSGPGGNVLISVPGVETTVNDDVSGIILLLVFLICAYLSWAFVKRRSMLFSSLGVLLVLVPCMCVNGIMPSWTSLMAVIIFLALVAIGAKAGKSNPLYGAKISMGFLPVVFLIVMLVSFVFPRESYVRPQYIKDLRLAILSNSFESDVDLNIDPSGAITFGNLSEVIHTGKTAFSLHDRREENYYLKGISGGVYTGEGWEQLPKEKYDEFSQFQQNRLFYINGINNAENWEHLYSTDIVDYFYSSDYEEIINDYNSNQDEENIVVEDGITYYSDVYTNEDGEEIEYRIEVTPEEDYNYEYEYGEDGEILKMWTEDSNGEVIITEFEYGENGEIVSARVKYPSGETYTYNYEYGENGERIGAWVETSFGEEYYESYEDYIDYYDNKPWEHPDYLSGFEYDIRIEMKKKTKGYILTPYFPVRGSILDYESVYDWGLKLAEESTRYTLLAYEEPTGKTTELDDNFKQYKSFVHENYLEVPEEEEAILWAFMKENGIEKGMYDPETEDAITIISKVKEILADTAEYSKTPGFAPDDRNWLEYFLNENKKGYCVYFATAGTLMYRLLGIPARYVEGYVVRHENFVRGVAEIPDNQAHAWVEIFDPELGWIPIEVTPGANNGLSIDDSIFAFGNMTTIPPTTAASQPSTSPPAGSTKPNNDAGAKSGGGIDTLTILILFVVLMLICIISAVISRLVCIHLRKRRFSLSGKNRKAIEMCRYAEQLTQYGGTIEPETESLFLKAQFSQHELTREEIVKIQKDLAKMCLEVRTANKGFKKLMLSIRGII